MIPMRLLVVCAVVAATATCGGGNSPAAPSAGAGSGGSGGASGPNFGTLTATIDGVAYTGTINLATNVNGVLNIASNSADRLLSVNLATSAAAGSQTISIANATVMQVIATNGTAVSGTWFASAVGGSGTLTITSINTTGASGTFSFNAVAGPTGGGAGTKVVTNGSFSARF
jgi:hypothetical protein